MIPVMNARQGGIGYMALGTALSNKVTLRSRSGEWVQANADSLGAAVRQVSWDAPDLYQRPELLTYRPMPPVMPAKAGIHVVCQAWH